MHGVFAPLRFRHEVLDGPRPVATPRRLPASAPVSVCLYKITDSAGDVWDSFQGQDIPMWQIQMDHPAQRPITFQMRDGMNDFLRNAHASGDCLFKNLVQVAVVGGEGGSDPPPQLGLI